MVYTTYIIESLKDSGYYIGSTKDINERIKRHNEGRSKATRGRRPWKPVFIKEFNTKSEAVKFEYYIKKQKSKKYIESLINKAR